MKQVGTIRQPAVAGRFYPATAGALGDEVARLLAANGCETASRRAACVMVPHAGYIYSGAVAAKVFAAVTVPETVVILCPNHTGRGARIAIAPAGAFAVPGAELAIDDELASAIAARVAGAARDSAAHAHEHAIEVQLPFIAARRADVRIVPIVLGGLSADRAIELGAHIHQAAASLGREVLLVASSDMSHFLPDERARVVDHQALAPLLAFDPRALYRTVVDHDISMCGFIPATAMLGYAAAAGAGAPELTGYATSGDVSGDRSRVVGYAGVIVPARA